MATTQDKDEKESPKKKGGKDLDDLKKEVPIVSALPLTSSDLSVICYLALVWFFMHVKHQTGSTQTPEKYHLKSKHSTSGITGSPS